jgi:hypothetical protein
VLPALFPGEKYTPETRVQTPDKIKINIINGSNRTKILEKLNNAPNMSKNRGKINK